MGDASLARLSGVFSLLSALSIIATVAIAVSSGAGGGPVAIDFGDPAVLARLEAGKPAVMWVETLALVGPTLALGAGLGWLHVLRSDGSYVGLGVLLWYLGMIFIVLQDAAELALVAQLPPAYAAATGAARAALLASGALLGGVVQVVMILGDTVSFFGVVLVSVALLRRPGLWRLLGGLGVAAALAVCVGFAVPALQALRGVGFPLFMIWMICMGIVMLRWKSAATTQSPGPPSSAL